MVNHSLTVVFFGRGGAYKNVSAVANWTARQKRAVDRAWRSAVNYSGRASQLGGIVNWVDRRRSSLSRSELPPCRAKLITRFDDRCAEAKFSKSGVWDKVPEGSSLPLFLKIPEFPFNTVEGSSRAKTQLDSSTRFDRTRTCDWLTDRQTDRAILYRASIASRE